MKRWFIAASALAATLVAGAFAVGFRPAGAEGFQPLAIVTCASPGPCQTYSNTNTSNSAVGLEGISTGGKGLIGQTKFNSTSTSNGQAGVQGQDLSTSGHFDMGVKGSSAKGFGVLGTSTSGVGVEGTSSSVNGSGISGISTNGTGLVGQSTNGSGVDSRSTTSFGLVSRTFHNSALTFFGVSGVFGGDGSSDGGHLNAGVTGSSFNGFGVVGSSDNWVGVNAVGGDFVSGDDFPALSIVGNTAGGLNNDLIDACPPSTANPCDRNNRVFRVTGAGDVDVTGAIDAGSAGFFTSRLLKNELTFARLTIHAIQSLA